MSKVSFNKLHALLEPKLSEIFFPKGGGKRTPGKSSYLIDSKTRLSIAIRFFSGASPLDIMQTHDVGLLTVYYTVWGVIDAINETECLAMRFPSHDRQREIAKGFLAMSGAGFRKVIGAIDGLLIATIMPPLAICRWLQCGQISFRCHRKDKYGFNLQGICDHTLRFIWYEMEWPGGTSDYMAFVTSALCIALESNAHTKKILDGFTFVGDNAYVKKPYMAVPLKGVQKGYRDAYNFYLSQLRITIERCFGVFVHRWAILRAPLTIPIQKVAPLVEALVRLHNYCIDENEHNLLEPRSKVVAYLEASVSSCKDLSGKDSELVGLDAKGAPSSLLGEGQHFGDAEHTRHDKKLSNTPMDRMLRRVKKKWLKRPDFD
ncbi:hypothetical protein ACHAWF_005314 [Thalassiosira exigua]